MKLCAFWELLIIINSENLISGKMHGYKKCSKNRKRGLNFNFREKVKISDPL